MNDHSDFHESYFEHGCSILHERDVLQIDIRENGSATNLKRWWYNLFLLSYSNKRARIYFNSSHAMRFERARHFRRYRSCIHPLSKFRDFWDFLVLLFMLIIKIIFNQAASLTSVQAPVPVIIIGIFFEFVILFDIFINATTGYVDDITRKIVLDSQKALHRYCYTKLFFHAASSMPLLTIMFMKYGMNIDCTKCKSNTFVITLRFLDVIRLFRLIELSLYWAKQRDTFKSTYFFRFLRIWILGLMTVMQYVAVTDNIDLLRLTQWKPIDLKQTYLSLLLKLKFLTKNPPGTFKLISYDFVRTFKSLMLFNFGFSVRSSYLDRLSSIIVYIIAIIFYLWGLCEVFSCCIRNLFPEDRIINNKIAAKNLAKCRQLPENISDKIDKYYHMTACKTVESQNGLLKCLPVILTREISMFCYSRKIMKVPYFSEWPMKLIEVMVSMLKEEIYLMGDVVAGCNILDNGLVIVDSGILAVYTKDHVETAHLEDGDYFGEVSLVSDKGPHSTYIVAVTNCKLIRLEKYAFRTLMKDHTELFFDMKQKLRFESHN